MAFPTIAKSAALLLLQVHGVGSLAHPWIRPSIAAHGHDGRARALTMSREQTAEPAVAVKPPLSKRAQRKANERARAQRKPKVNGNKAASQHPEAVAKRAQQSSQPQQQRRNRRRKHNYADRADFLKQKEGYENHPLHSRAVDHLDKGTSAEEVVKAIKRAQNLHDVHDIREIAHFLLEEVDVSFAYGYRGSLLSRLAVAALHMDKLSIADRCIIERRRSHRSSMLPMESAAIVRGLLRCHRVDAALNILEDELSLPPEGWAQFDTCDMGDDDEVHLEEECVRRQLEIRDRLVHRARGICSIASRHFYEGEPTAGMDAMKRLREMGGIVRDSGLTPAELGMPWERLVRGAAGCEGMRRDGKWDGKVNGNKEGTIEGDGEDPSRWPCNIVYSVLDAMVAFPPENGDRAFEALCHALVRRTVFVTGAVDMAGCPEADRGEVAFIGRSNVGKSSLVNMLTNRKSLAFTSKTPGKTQQFNYFAVNDKPDLERQIRYGDNVAGTPDRDAFYMVDLPGFGFAKVPREQRRQWSDFMDEYITNRETLRVIFHLIDARHGPTEEDRKIMKRVGSMLESDARRNNAKYVVVLTKADKNVKGARSARNPGRVSEAVLQKLDDAMRSNGVGYAPVVSTSAETRLGRDEVWKYLRLAAEE